jgi:ABC-type uncharacterized transport system auxiliary subunit
LATALLVAAALSLGCIAASSPPDRHFGLGAGEPEAVLPTPALLGTLVVRRPAANGLTDGLELVYREEIDSPEFRKHTYVLWIDPPTRLLQRELVTYLRAAGLAQRVVPPEVRIEPDYELSTWVRRLDRVVDGSGTIVLELEFILMRTRDRELALSSTYRAERQTGSNDVEAAVAAYGEALGDILARFVAEAQASVLPQRRAGK